MKGAFEYAFLMICAMPFIVIGMNFVEVMMQYNNARYLKEYAISAILHQNRYDESVDALIAPQAALYPDLDLEIAKTDERFLVTVRFPVQIPILDYAMNGEVTSYTMLVD